MAIRSFPVIYKRPDLIVPAKPTPREIKQLSDIDDQRGLRFHFPMIMFYQNSEGKDTVRVIREALAKTLVHYYPYAGRLIAGPNDNLMVDCSSEGVMFVEADADLRLEQLGDMLVQPSCPFSPELLYDGFASQGMVGCPLMLIQVTRFICGGISLAIRTNHVISDATGVVQFLKSVAEIARGALAPCIQPVWIRELMNARYPPRITCVHQEFEDNVDNISINGGIMDHDNLVHRWFFFGPKEITALRKHLQPNLRNSSKFEVITACVWRSRTIALQLPPDRDVLITCMINVSGKNHLNLPNGYYGNAIVSTAVVSKVKILCENPLGYALEQLKKAKVKVNEEYIRSVIDLMATKGRPPFSTSWNFIVSDGSRVGFDDIDFGWGKPIYGGTMDGGTSTISIYARFRNTKGEHGILVPMCLPEAIMERFEEELKKLTQESKGDLNELKTIKIASML